MVSSPPSSKQPAVAHETRHGLNGSAVRAPPPLLPTQQQSAALAGRTPGRLQANPAFPPRRASPWPLIIATATPWMSASRSPFPRLSCAGFAITMRACAALCNVTGCWMLLACSRCMTLSTARLRHPTARFPARAPPSPACFVPVSCAFIVRLTIGAWLYLTLTDCQHKTCRRGEHASRRAFGRRLLVVQARRRPPLQRSELRSMKRTTEQSSKSK